MTTDMHKRTRKAAAWVALFTFASVGSWEAFAAKKGESNLFKQHPIFIFKQFRERVSKLPGQTKDAVKNTFQGFRNRMKNESANKNVFTIRQKPKIGEAEKALILGDIDLIQDPFKEVKTQKPQGKSTVASTVGEKMRHVGSSVGTAFTNAGKATQGAVQQVAQATNNAGKAIQKRMTSVGNQIMRRPNEKGTQRMKKPTVESLDEELSAPSSDDDMMVVSAQKNDNSFSLQDNDSVVRRKIQKVKELVNDIEMALYAKRLNIKPLDATMSQIVSPLTKRMGNMKRNLVAAATP